MTQYELGSARLRLPVSAKYFYGGLSVGTTPVELVAGVTDKQILLWSITISASNGRQWTLEDDTNELWTVAMATDRVTVANFYPFYIPCTEAESLYIKSNNTAISVFVNLWYSIANPIDV
jgi:hypothetical protein